MADAQARTPRRSRLGLYLCIAVAVIALGLILWFLPALAARSSIRDKMVKEAIPWFRGSVSLGEVSLGWLSPVRVRGIAVQDEHGAPLAEVAEAATARTLLAILLNSQNLGEIQLTQPVVHAEVRPGGSNLEDALAPFLELDSGEASVALVLNIAGGKCIVRDDAGRETVLSEIDAAVAVPGEKSLPYKVDLAANISGGETSGACKLTGDWRPADAPWGVGALNCLTSTVPLAALAPVLSRGGVEAELAGSLDGRCEVTLGETGEGTIAMERIAAEGLAMRAPQYIGQDEVRLSQLALSGKISFSEHVVALEGVDLVCDVGEMRITGAVPRSALSAGRLAGAWRETSFDADGQLDLAKLAQQFPQTLRLREGLSVTSGAVQIACTTRGEQGGRRWEGRLEMSGLAADHQGRRITWDRPLSATFAIRESEQGPVIDQLACESDFFRASGSGSLAEGRLSLEGDLSKLAAELSRFVDLGETQFGGAVKGDLQWRREGDADNLIAANGIVGLTNFEWSLPGRRVWREPELAINFSVAGIADNGGIRHIDRGQIQLAASGDSALVRLTAPVENPGAVAVWPVHLEAAGELASWAPRVENFASLPAGTIEGNFSIAASGLASKSQAQMDNVELAIDSLYFEGDRFSIREPRVEGQGDIAWDGAAQTIAVKEAMFSSSSVAFRAQNVALNLPPSLPSASGKVDFRADLARISSWLVAPEAPPAAQLSGLATGQIEARLTGSGVIQLQGAADVENFAYSPSASLAVSRAEVTPVSAAASAPLWQEPRLRLTYNASYMPETAELTAEQLSIAGEAISITAKGKVTEATTICRVDLTGQHDYDLAKLTNRLRPWLGPDLKMAGRGPRPFTLAGPLFMARGGESFSANQATPLVPPELTGKTSLAWTSAEYNGIKTAAGEAAIELKDGVILLGPLDLPVSDGRLTLAPKLPLNVVPLAVSVDAGPVLQNVRITPEMCRSWLKYVAPLVADATEAQGKFSIELVRPARVPLADPKLGEVAGLMKAHTAQVGPGPLSRKFLTLADQIKAVAERKPLPTGESGSAVWLQLPEQAISFETAGGRVYHRDLTVTAKDVLIRTRGSVGLDQSLELLAEVPIQDQWIEREPLLAIFRGQSLQVPVGGSLTSPRLDNAGLDRLAQQMLGNAAQRLLEDNLKPPPEIKNALDRLFRGK
jgi:hypothetical protein